MLSDYPIIFYKWLIKSNDIRFDNDYLYFIIAAQIFHTIAWGCTVYVLTFYPTMYTECVVATANNFQMYGYVATWFYQSIIIVMYCFIVPIFFAETNKVQFRSTVFIMIMVIFLAIDALNDVTALIGWYQANDVLVQVMQTGASPGTIKC
jgi:hypothetical protein